ncbi:MAG: class I SAM-dependent methyltransferase [Actinomycetota bacterium]
MTDETVPRLRPVTPVGLAVEALEQGEPDRALALLRDLDAYLSASSSPASPALSELARRSDLHPWDPDRPLEAEMLSGHVEGRLLSLLVKLSGATRILDIGTFTGYSALSMAEAVEPGGEVVTCELDQGVADMAAAAFAGSPVADRIRLEVGPALETLRRLADAGERFDLAFLDADKPGYLPVYRALLDLGLVGPGGLIVADNTLLQGQPYAGGVEVDANGAAIAEFNAALTADDRVEQVLLPVRDGVTLARVSAP